MAPGAPELATGVRGMTASAHLTASGHLFDEQRTASFAIA